MSEAEPLRVLHITDPHLHADPATELYGVNTDASLRAVIGAALPPDRRPPDAVLVTGDLVEDRSRRGYERFRSIMQSVDVPVHCLPGNHDDPELIARILNDGNFSYCSSADMGAWRFILLNSHVAGDDGGALADAELRRLETELAGSREKNVLVAVHHQPLDMGSAWLDGYGLRNATEFLSALSPHRNVRIVLWGHVHQASDRDYDEKRMLSTPSTCAQFSPGTTKCAMDIRPPGYRELELWDNGRIDTDVVWLDDWVVSERPPDTRTQGAEGNRQ